MNRIYPIGGQPADPAAAKRHDESVRHALTEHTNRWAAANDLPEAEKWDLAHGDITMRGRMRSEAHVRAWAAAQDVQVRDNGLRVSADVRAGYDRVVVWALSDAYLAEKAAVADANDVPREHPVMVTLSDGDGVDVDAEVVDVPVVEVAPADDGPVAVCDHCVAPIRWTADGVPAWVHADGGVRCADTLTSTAAAPSKATRPECSHCGAYSWWDTKAATWMCQDAKTFGPGHICGRQPVRPVSTFAALHPEGGAR